MSYEDGLYRAAQIYTDEIYNQRVTIEKLTAERDRLRRLLRDTANKIRRGRATADDAAKIDAALRGADDE